MSKKLKVRTLVRKRPIRGKYSWVITLKRNNHRAKRAKGNGQEMQEIRQLLRNSAAGKYRIEHEQNRRGDRVYTRILLQQSMDVALLKLCHHEVMQDIYKLQITEEETALAA
jgi:hypothetical protein